MKAIGAIVWKDLAAELRSRELLSAMLVFALLVILIFNFAIELQPKPARNHYTGRVMGYLRFCRDAWFEPLDGR